MGVVLGVIQDLLCLTVTLGNSSDEISDLPFLFQELLRVNVPGLDVIRRFLQLLIQISVTNLQGLKIYGNAAAAALRFEIRRQFRLHVLNVADGRVFDLAVVAIDIELRKMRCDFCRCFDLWHVYPPRLLSFSLG